jgi:hypothetical protein
LVSLRVKRPEDLPFEQAFARIATALLATPAASD